MSEKARVFATAAHAACGQRRKYTGEPYIVHPADVVNILGTHLSVDKVSTLDYYDMQDAAWLHDVVEDTQVTIETIREEFGDKVAAIVQGLTAVDVPKDRNRAVRKHNELVRLSGCSYLVKTVKLADLISNTKSITECDAKFAAVYMAEKRQLLDHALKDGDPNLWAMADKICNDYFEGVAND